MFTIGKQFRFEAAHHLPNHAGLCQNVHGHSYLVEVTLAGPALQVAGSSEGMLLDFGTLSTAMKPILEQLDHHDLNVVFADSFLPPTAEMLASYIYNQLKPQPLGEVLQEVRVWETDTCWAAYSQDW